MQFIRFVQAPLQAFDAGCRHALSFMLMLLLASSPACAFIDKPTFSPAHPLPGQEVTMSVRAAECDYFFLDEGWFSPEIKRVGNHIQVVLVGDHEEHDFDWSCQLPVEVTTVSLGVLPAGSYTVDVDRIYFEMVIFYDPVTVATASLDVAPPQAVPAFSTYAGALLFVVLALAAAWTGKMTAQSSRIWVPRCAGPATVVEA